jgi:hypothetical protein
MGSMLNVGNWISNTAPRLKHFVESEQHGELNQAIARQNPNELYELTMVWPKEIACSIV